MDGILDLFMSFWQFIIYVFSEIRINDIIDIIVIAFLIYKFIEFFRQTRGGQLIKGLIILLVITFVAQLLNMVMVKWLTVKLVDSLLVVAVVVFQPELRRALERVGTSKFGAFARGGADSFYSELLTRQIDAISKAAGTMQEQKCGALMVIERATQLGEIVATGTVIKAVPTMSLICNIFFPNSPLHDGAMIFRDGKILAAGCILPLTQNSEISKDLGTRHRAALGMSENSDAVIVVVSEETGTISLAVNGVLKRNFDTITLRTELTSLLIDEQEKANVGIFGRFKEKLSSLKGKILNKSKK